MRARPPTVFLAAAAVATAAACNGILGVGDPDVVGADASNDGAASIAHKDAAADHTLDVAAKEKDATHATSSAGGDASREAGHDAETSSGSGSASASGSGSGSASGTGSSSASGTGVGDAMVNPDNAPYPAAVLHDGPVAYWRFNDMAGATAFDETGHGYALLLSGTITTGVAGALKSQPNLAFLLDGQTSNLVNASFPEFTGTHPYTLEAWLKPTEARDAEAHDSVFRELFQRASYQTNDRQGYDIFLQSGLLVFERYVGGENKRIETTVPPTGTFTYVVGVYDGTALILYINGVDVGSHAPDPRDTVATGSNIDIGCNTYPDSGVIEGVIDEIAIYDYALPAANIAAHFMAASQP